MNKISIIQYQEVSKLRKLSS